MFFTIFSESKYTHCSQELSREKLLEGLLPSQPRDSLSGDSPAAQADGIVPYHLSPLTSPWDGLFVWDSAVLYSRWISDGHVTSYWLLSGLSVPLPRVGGRDSGSLR
jgi:hypothetical protein